MKRSSTKTDAKGIFPQVRRVRRDQISVELVEKGIALQEACGTSKAAKYLQSQWISMDVALRVLARPAQRRYQNFVIS
jgi:diaminopimelate epimerase